MTEPKGVLTTSVPDDFKTSYVYNAVDQMISMTDADGGLTSYSYDNVGNLTKVVDPVKNATADTGDFTTQYDYNIAGWPTTTTDAAGKTTSVTYDFDGLVNKQTDQDGNQTLLTLDARGKVRQASVPHKLQDPGNPDSIVYHTTKYTYDENGNTTKVESPRGVATGAAGDFTSETVYDEMNRITERRTPFDPADTNPDYRSHVSTLFSYDGVGRLSKVSAPPSDGQSVRNDTTYGYFDNGWTKTSADPWDITTSYDYNDLGQQIERIVSSAGGSASRTQGWGYYLSGNLASRTDDGVPVGAATVLVDNSDTQNTAASPTGNWATGTAAPGHHGFDYRTHAAGTGSDEFTWKLRIPDDGTYQVFVKHPDVSGAATNAAYTITHATGTANQTLNQQTNAGEWRSLGSFTFDEQATGQKIVLKQNAGGIVSADAIKLVRDNSGEADNELIDFSYRYDPNGNLKLITDASPGAAINGYDVTYTDLNQVEEVLEKAGAQTKHTTTLDYHPNGTLASRTHDNKAIDYAYEVRDLLSEVTDNTGTTPKITSYTYDDRGMRLQETKPNQNTVTYGYYLDGLLKSQEETKPGGTVVTGHDLTWDPNGNKLSDVARRMNADNHAATLTTTSAYVYDPLDRIRSLTKTGTSAGSESYVHDANNNVISQQIGGVATSYSYNRNRLVSATTSGTTANYNYDPFGRLDTVTAADELVESYRYDGFDRIKRHTKNTGTSTTYTYDPLDRTASKTTDVGGAGEKTTDYEYLGHSNKVVTELVAGQVKKSFSYDAYGQRLTQTTALDGGGSEDAHYSYSPHTDVDALTDAAGDTKATYGYTAYGNDDEDLFTGIDKPDTQNPDQEPYNPYRYTAKRYDPATNSYDLGFRDYSPGLNRFLTRDTYNGALADMNLATDPFNGNRYGYAAGNPITRLDYDGHYAIEEDGTPLGSDGTPIGLPTRRTAPTPQLQTDPTGGSGPATSPQTDRTRTYCGSSTSPLNSTGAYGSGCAGLGGTGITPRTYTSGTAGPMDVLAAGGMFLAEDYINCANSPGISASCGLAAASIIPVGKLAAIAGKAVIGGVKLAVKGVRRTRTAAKAGTSALDALSPAVRSNVDDAIQRAAAGKIRFPGHDGKVYGNSDELLPRGGNYTEWTAAEAGAKRGVHRVIIEGDPANPNAIYYWDHVNAPTWIGP
ncbi:RHS repeat-associated core domain-containing protein [Actinopolymorpha sp. B9G3]|uniref:golvesin C-terminal-like domain-containing protein n=1 Tax=Actinopolymorpha sp. B9G3 TaxID=3158970 RepID=UPI0032D90514